MMHLTFNAYQRLNHFLYLSFSFNDATLQRHLSMTTYLFQQAKYDYVFSCVSQGLTSRPGLLLYFRKSAVNKDRYEIEDHLHRASPCSDSESSR